MNASEVEFIRTLRTTFKVEAEEHLQAIAEGLLELEKSPAPEAQGLIIETVFRAAHSLKGAARAVDLIQIESYCQSLEDVFASWKGRESDISTVALDTAHRTLDAITAAMSAPEASRGADTISRELQPDLPPQPLADPVRDERKESPSAAVIPPPERAAADRSSADETVRIPVSKLDAQLLAAQEMLAVKLFADRHSNDLDELARSFEEWRKEWAAVQPELRVLRGELARSTARTSEGNSGTARVVEFLDWYTVRLKSVEDRVQSLAAKAAQDRHATGKLVDDLLEDSKKLLLLPFSTMGVSFPRLVRDLCRDQGKEAEFLMSGEDVEIDKRVLEEIKDPLIHLLRNCVDHGIEPPQRRAQLGKPLRATITLSVTQVNGSKVEFRVSDDGTGLDLDRVKESAVKRGLLTADAARQLSEADASALIFRADLSTSPIITRLSGRGLGLAIAREKAEKLGGTVSVESRPGEGTTFRIVVPLVIATFRGILIKAEDRLFLLPTLSVERVVRLMQDDIQTVEGRETMSINGSALALVRLADVLAMPRGQGNGEGSEDAAVVVLGTGKERIAFLVDDVLDEHEVLFKPLVKPMSRVRNLAGVTVLSSGVVIPILNAADLLKSARKIGSASVRGSHGAKPAAARAKTLLVAEDSITSRMLIKSILESAGYKVKTAVDGVEAFALLRAEPCDLVVSDVEMPRMNGFDLTEKIRADKRLAELPVVLVTALETREDRERGIDAGANAYIVKSSFDQSNLLDAVRRLV